MREEGAPFFHTLGVHKNFPVTSYICMDTIKNNHNYTHTNIFVLVSNKLYTLNSIM